MGGSPNADGKTTSEGKLLGVGAVAAFASQLAGLLPPPWGMVASIAVIAVYVTLRTALKVARLTAEMRMFQAGPGG